MDDVLDVGLGAETVEGGGVVFGGGGLDGGDAEVFVASGEMGSGRGDAGFGVARDGGVAVEDEVAVRGDGVGVELGVRQGCGGEE